MKSDPPDAAMDAQIAFRRMAHSDVLESEIRTRVAWLEQFYGDIGGGWCAAYALFGISLICPAALGREAGAAGGFSGARRKIPRGSCASCTFLPVGGAAPMVPWLQTTVWEVLWPTA